MNSLKLFWWATRPFSKVLVNFAICYLFAMLVQNTKYTSKIEKSPPTFSKTSYNNARRNYNDVKKLKALFRDLRKAIFKHFKVIQGSLGFCFSSCGFRIPGTQLRIPCRWNLDSQFQSLADSFSWITTNIGNTNGIMNLSLISWISFICRYLLETMTVALLFVITWPSLLRVVTFVWSRQNGTTTYQWE